MLLKSYILVGGKGKEVPVHTTKLNGLYFLPSIIRVIKPIRRRWAGHVARMATGEVYAEFWWGYLTERDHLENVGPGGRIT